MQEHFFEVKLTLPGYMNIWFCGMKAGEDFHGKARFLIFVYCWSFNSQFMVKKITLCRKVGKRQTISLNSTLYVRWKFELRKLRKIYNENKLTNTPQHQNKISIHIGNIGKTSP